jgi:hypothetical protein
MAETKIKKWKEVAENVKSAAVRNKNAAAVDLVKRLRLGGGGKNEGL